MLHGGKFLGMPCPTITCLGISHNRNATRQSKVSPITTSQLIRISQHNRLPSISPLETMFPSVILLASASAKPTTKALLMDIIICDAEAPLYNIRNPSTNSPWTWMTKMKRGPKYNILQARLFCQHQSQMW